MSAFGNAIVTLLTAQVGKHNFYRYTGFPATVYAAHPSYNNHGFPWDSAVVAYGCLTADSSGVTLTTPPGRLLAHEWETKIGTPNDWLMFGPGAVHAGSATPAAGDIAVFEGAHVGVVQAYDATHQKLTVLDGSRVALDPNFRVFKRVYDPFDVRTFIRPR